MKYMTFQDRFHELVRTGKKTQTIRPVRKRNPIITGERISLRGWRGKPYRSKQFELVQGDVFQTARIVINWYSVYLNERLLGDSELADLTSNDGFACVPEFFEWFDNNHNIRNGVRPFVGTLFRWSLHFPIREAICAHALEESIRNNPLRNLIEQSSTSILNKKIATIRKRDMDLLNEPER